MQAPISRISRIREQDPSSLNARLSQRLQIAVRDAGGIPECRVERLEQASNGRQVEGKWRVEDGSLHVPSARLE